MPPTAIRSWLNSSFLFTFGATLPTGSERRSSYVRSTYPIKPTWMLKPEHSTLPIERHRISLSRTLNRYGHGASYTVVIKLIFAINPGSNTTNWFWEKFGYSFDSKKLPEEVNIQDNVYLKQLPIGWYWIGLCWAEQSQRTVGFGHKYAHFVFYLNLGPHTANGLWKFTFLRHTPYLNSRKKTVIWWAVLNNVFT